MKKLAGKFFYISCALFVLYLLVLWMEWLPPSTPAGKKAVAIMEAPLPVIADRENAFGEFWLFPFDIPDADKAKVLAVDIEKFSQPAEGASTALDEYPIFEDADDLLCKPREDGCIEKLRSSQDKYREFFAQNSKLSDKAVALTRYKSSRSQFRADLATPLPNFPAPANWQLTTAAWWHVQGKQAESIDLACRAASSWRGMAENSQGLIDQMVGLAFYAGMSRLLSEILSETPNEFELPTSCDDAYRPVELKKFPVCQSIKLEYRMMMGIETDPKTVSGPSPDMKGQSGTVNRMNSLWNNKRATKEKFALGFVEQCSDDREILKESEKPKENFWNGLSFTELVFNPIGGILANISLSDYSHYSERMQNLVVIRQAMQIVLDDRIGKQPASSAATDISIPGNMRLNRDAKTVEVDLYKGANKTEKLSLRLAGSRQAK
ncbi:MAG: hypothetical protein ACREO1_07405 [Arenimonas sp.]